MQLIKEPGLLQQAGPSGALGIPVALGWLVVDGAEAGSGALLRGSGEESSLGQRWLWRWHLPPRLSLLHLSCLFDLASVILGHAHNLSMCRGE